MTDTPRPAGTLLVGHHDVVALLPMAECIDAMTDALRTLARGGALLPLRTVVRLADGRNAFALMPAVLDEPSALGAKVITVFPGNDATPYDSHQGAVLLFDLEHGRLIAILDASTITALRTAAVYGRRNACAVAAGVADDSRCSAPACRPRRTSSRSASFVRSIVSACGVASGERAKRFARTRRRDGRADRTRVRRLERRSTAPTSSAR